MGNKDIVQAICVVLDTNIWVYDSYMLRTPKGAALLFAIKRRKACIGLPEVVELELEKHITKLGLEAVEKVTQGYSVIEKLVGARDDYKIPCEEELKKALSDRLNQLKDMIMRVPYTFEHSKSALKRIMDEKPPNSLKNQQFKDSCIWEAILEIAETYEVHFITHDNGFFENRKPENGLAKTLKSEIKQLEFPIKVHSSIEQFLDEMNESVSQFDMSTVAVALRDYFTNKFKEPEYNYLLEDVKDYSISAYLTEEHNNLLIVFDVNFTGTAFDNDVQSECDAIINVKGECAFAIDDSLVNFVQLQSVFAYDTNGKQLSGSLYITAEMSSGRNSIQYKLRSPLI